jgi:hypothetical protein
LGAGVEALVPQALAELDDLVLDIREVVNS